MTDRTQVPVIYKLSSEINKKIQNSFTYIHNDQILVGKNKYCFPQKYETFARELLEFEIRPDDTWVVTYPRSGTTLTQELVWMVANDCDFEKCKESLNARFPYFEYSIVDEQWNTRGQPYAETWHDVAAMQSPRFVKSHLPLELLPPNLLSSGAKVVYVARNPKDVAVSWCHFERAVTGYVGDFATFWEFFEKNLTSYSPYWSHVIEGWNHRHAPNLLFLFYEDLIKDLPGSILKVSKFLNKDVTEEQISNLARHLQIDNFKKNPSVNWELHSKTNCGFIRNGKVGEGVREFSPDLLERAEKWIQENMKNTNLKFQV